MRLKLFFQVLGLELRKQMSYRADFWVNAIVSFLASMAVMYFLWESIFANLDTNETIGGYTLQGMILYYVLVILIGKLVRGAQMMEGISTDIYTGGLTRYQVYPTSYLAYKYAEHLGGLLPALVQITLFGGAVPFFFDIPETVHFSLLNILLAVLVILLANLLYFMMTLPLQLVAFWADNVWSLLVMVHFIAALLGGAMLPLELFPGWIRDILQYSPFGYLYHFPVTVLTGQVEPGKICFGLAVMLFWVIILGSVGRVIWHSGNKQYTGVGI